MNIAVIGTGYVGLVTGTCFAEMGNRVACVDIDKKKIKNLKKGIMPIYEPGLEELVKANYADKRLHFVTSLAEVPFIPQIIFIAVGTPSDEDGSADLKYVLAAGRDVGKYIKNYTVIVDKSTVPVMTADKVKKVVQEELEVRKESIPFDVVSNPEFLKEGSAIDDCMRPDRVVVGVDSEKAKEIIHEIYAPFTRNHERMICMGIRDAEMTKYAANAMLATKISFMNEIAGICECVGVDVENVRLGIGSDSRIGYPFIYPGCGYGGSCFPKDVKALVKTAEMCSFEPKVLKAVEARNYEQKQVLGKKLVSKLGEDLSGINIAVWGLSFKPGTDDMREATSGVFLHDVIGRGAKVKAYDPEAMKVAREELPSEWFSSGKLELMEHQKLALPDTDVLALLTEWKQFRNPDFTEIKKHMRGNLILDGRNQYNPQHLKDLGFEYMGIGR
jgi:UDPglucose 6-dehydrogenase